MSDDAGDPLQRWCARTGLARGYEDIWGHRHEAPDDTVRALLAELGVAEAGAPALADAEGADWRTPLPPVLAVQAGAPTIDVPIRLPAEARRLRWTLREESGAQQAGDLAVAECREDGRAQVDGVEFVALRLVLVQALPIGYHELRVGWDEHVADAPHALVIAAPARCFRPPALEGEGRTWGPAVQLYSLRSERNWGIGDFTDLARLVEDFGRRGAGLVGLNPLHAMFPHDPARRSPYSPSSRTGLNVLYLDVEAIDDFRECEPAQQAVRSAAFQQRLAGLRASVEVDAGGVAAAKREILQLLARHFRERHLRTASERGRAFRAWQAARGEALRLHATFDALQEHLQARDASLWGWPAWPAELRDPRSPAVREFQSARLDRVEYFEYLQWQADEQLARVSRNARERGLAVGLYLDLAVSVDRAGADAWAHARLFAPGASVGAPPDELNRNGQDWGLPPLNPAALLQDRLAFFRDTLRACMRHAGALRIDHVMGLMRLYWIAPGRGPRDGGAYVHYPLRELLAVVALESERNGCMVVGEDLGTVADEMRSALVRHEVLSYRLLYFERDANGAFRAPHAYPREALVAVGTHDLATFAGWWQGRDLQLRRDLALFPDDALYEEQLAGRAQDRVRLLLALQHAGLLPAGLRPDECSVPALTPALVEAVHAFVASTPSRLMAMQLEDALGVVDQVNMPGTVDQHPNWRQKLPVALEAMASHEGLAALCGRLAALRPHAPLRADAAPRAEAIVPRATYRLQFHKDFTFDDARAVLPYLDRLGVSHVYCSPLMRARPGSLHGYDVVAHDEINPELGGRAGFDRFSAAARERGLGLLLDMVPNHMGIGPDNAWWMDVLENGPASPYARYFDIEWHPADPALAGKVLLPVLGEHYGVVLERGELKLAFDAAEGRFSLRYWDHRFPVDPRTAAPLLRRAAQRCEGACALALQSLASALANLPPRDAEDPSDLAERERDKVLLRERLATTLRDAPQAGAALEAAVAETNGADELDALHEAQAYRLAYWRVASDEINYRRFFDINELAALRVEEPAVFEATQGLALELAARGQVDGLRIDHPDGLHDPAQYFERLQQGYARRTGLVLPAAGERGRPARPLYVVAEKIAAGHEDVPDAWALHGTTGYRFANVVNGVFVDTTARERFDRLWRHASGETADFHELAWRGKRQVMRSSLASELSVLATELLRIARAHRRTRDHTWNTLREALAEVAACMPVYRTYVVDVPSPQDRRFVDWAVARARRRSPLADASAFDFVRRTLLAQAEEGAGDALRERVRRFAMRFQQFSSPVTAKGVEDTAFYRYHRLVALNEVGGEPGTFGMTLRGFHAASADRAARWPHTLIATSTHDNKRSEDVRCRLDVLSEMPGAWRLALRRFARAPQLQRVRASGEPEAADAPAVPIPSAADEYLLVQTLLGTLPAGGLAEDELPAYRERIEQYMRKAVREAKLHTSWLNPEPAYEDALLAFVRSVLGRLRPNPLLGELQAQADLLAWFGAFNSLSMTALKLTSPGVPDVYQGNELLDLSLVDPDNRRPVDYALRGRLLDELAALGEGAGLAAALREYARTPTDGRLKLWVTWRLMHLRRERAATYRDGGYAALQAEGTHAEQVVAFVRGAGADAAVTIAGRFFARLLGLRPEAPLGPAWADTRVALPALPDGARLENRITGETVTVEDGHVRLSEVFSTLPVAVLVGA